MSYGGERVVIPEPDAHCAEESVHFSKYHGRRFGFFPRLFFVGGATILCLIGAYLAVTKLPYHFKYREAERLAEMTIGDGIAPLLPHEEKIWYERMGVRGKPTYSDLVSFIDSTDDLR